MEDDGGAFTAYSLQNLSADKVVQPFTVAEIYAFLSMICFIKKFCHIYSGGTQVFIHITFYYLLGPHIEDI